MRVLAADSTARARWIGGTFLGVYSLSLWFYWHPASDAGANVAGQASPDATPGLKKPAGSDIPVSSDEPAALPRALPSAPPAQPAAAAAAVVPVNFHYRHRGDLGRIEGSVTNLSGDALVVEVTAFHRAENRGGKLQLQLAPYSSQTFGTDDSLELKPGDRVTVSCAPYQSRDFEIR